MVPRREVVLHKTGGKAAKVVRGGRGLTERRWLLVWRERPPEMWRSLLENAQETFEKHVETGSSEPKPTHACMRGGKEGSRWPQGGWSGWFPHGGCWSNEPGPPHDGGPGSDPPGPLQRPPSRGGPPLQLPCSRWSFHMPSWLFHGGQGGGGWFGSKEGWRRTKGQSVHHIKGARRLLVLKMGTMKGMCLYRLVWVPRADLLVIVPCRFVGGDIRGPAGITGVLRP